MVKITALTLGALLSVSTVTAKLMQVNYYYDGGCTDFASSIKNPPDGKSYGWDWTNSNSANIANCDGYEYCWCTFYTQPNSGGPSQTVEYGKNNCASNWGSGFKSFTCTYGSIGFKKEKRETTVSGEIPEPI